MKYGALAFDNNEWMVSGLMPHVAIRFKHLFPAISKSSTGPFRLTNTLDNAADLYWFTQRYPLECSARDKRKLSRRNGDFTRLLDKAESMLAPEYTPHSRTGLMPGESLRDYQLVALDFIDVMKSLLLIDDLGLGKTYEGLGISLLDGGCPLVVVCEPHLQEQWKKKAEQFLDANIHAVKGNTPYELPSADVYLFKYTQLSPWVDVLSAGWVKAIVFDEVQSLRRGRDSAKGLAAANICSGITIKVGMTGTLIYNYGIEAWCIIDILRPGLLGTKEEFTREWCDDNGIVKDPDALGFYLREAQMLLRRTKSDVGQEAKQQAPHLEWVGHNKGAVKEAEDLAESLAITTLTGDFTTSGMAAREFDMKMREMTGIAKAHQAAAFARMFVETGTPIILFGWHHEVYRIWESELSDLKPVFYTGKETQAQKEKNKQAFIDGETDILIMSLRSGAGADGLQHRCSTAIFGELDWSPKVHEQCIGRLDRDGQEEEVFVFYAVTEFGSDPVIIDVLGLKELQSRGIQDPGEKPMLHTANVNRVKHLAREYLNNKGIKVEEEVPEAVQSDEDLVAEI